LSIAATAVRVYDSKRIGAILRPMIHTSKR